MRLISRWQNSAGERVRIALQLKNLNYDYVPVSALKAGEYQKLNPQGLLPALDVDGQIIAQSSAILEYIEEKFPEPSLLPTEPVLRAQARAFGAMITAEIHALTVQRIRRFLQSEMRIADPDVTRWIEHWMTLGFSALEETLAQRPIQSPFCFGDRPGWADLHLIPQISTARRLECDLSRYPLLLSVEERCVNLDAFRLSRPEAQSDYPTSQKS